MELQSAEVVHEPSRPCGKRRRLGRGLMMVVAALGLIAVMALGATLVPRYLGGHRSAPVVTPHPAGLPRLHLSRLRRAPSEYGRGRAVARGYEPGRDQDRTGGGGHIPSHHSAAWDGDG